MKKITILVSEKEKVKFISWLSKIGLIHVRHVKPPSHHEIAFLEERIARIEKMISILEPYEKNHKRQGLPPVLGRKILDEEETIEEIYEEKQALLVRNEDIKKRLTWFEEWGHFNPEDIVFLRKKGIHIRLYRAQKSFLKKDEAQGSFYVINKDKEFVNLAIISSSPETKLPFEEAILPALSPEKLQEEKGKTETRIKEIDNALNEECKRLGTVKAYLKELEKAHESLSVMFGMQEEGRFSYLQGFCPAKKVEKITSIAKEKGIGLLIEEPDNLEETPTLISNPRWIRIIEPVFKFMNILPGYMEFDISFPFLVFFSIFFAMLIGDAGYGLLFLAATFFARRKFSNLPKEPFFLMYLLSISTIIWGAITGTWFGAERIAELPFFKDLIIERINSFRDESQNVLIFMCFVIGTVHLMLAHLLKTIRIINSLNALAEIGWMLIVCGMFFAAGKFVVGMAFPSFASWFLIIGTLLALLFSNPEKGIIKGAFITLINLPLSVVGAFGDVVSYLRLFAVGYASFAIAVSFNELATTLGASSAVGSFFAAVILFFGHALNIVLGLMAVIVHGLRLNMLEFSSHLGMQWTGKKYEPFCE